MMGDAVGQIVLRMIGMQAPVNVSENDLASLEPAANFQSDEILEKFNPPSTYKFPKRKFGSTVITERGFQSHWCDIYKWLHYDKVLK